MPVRRRGNGVAARASPAVRHYGTARATRLESTQTTASQPTARRVRGNQQLTGAFRYGQGYEQ